MENSAQRSFSGQVLVIGKSSSRIFDRKYDVSRLPRFEELRKLYRTFSRPLILDLGANIGLASLYLMRSWPTATVVAVEPDAET